MKFTDLRMCGGAVAILGFQCAPACGVARWDGTNWSALGSSPAFPQLSGGRTRIFALAVSGDDLFVGGGFSHARGQAASSLARYLLQPDVTFDPPASSNGGTFVLRLRGVAGMRFRLEHTQDFSAWSELSTGRGEEDM